MRMTSLAPGSSVSSAGSAGSSLQRLMAQIRQSGDERGGQDARSASMTTRFWLRLTLALHPGCALRPRSTAEIAAASAAPGSDRRIRAAYARIAATRSSGETATQAGQAIESAVILGIGHGQSPHRRSERVKVAVPSGMAIDLQHPFALGQALGRDIGSVFHPAHCRADVILHLGRTAHERRQDRAASRAGPRGR